MHFWLQPQQEWLLPLGIIYSVRGLVSPQKAEKFSTQKHFVLNSPYWGLKVVDHTLYFSTQRLRTAGDLYMQQAMSCITSAQLMKKRWISDLRFLDFFTFLWMNVMAVTSFQGWFFPLSSSVFSFHFVDLSLVSCSSLMTCSQHLRQR